MPQELTLLGEFFDSFDFLLIIGGVLYLKREIDRVCESLEKHLEDCKQYRKEMRDDGSEMRDRVSRIEGKTDLT